MKWFNKTVSFVQEIVMNDIDSTNGIKITVDTPAGNNHMLNIIRPGVLRQEYGLTVDDFNTVDVKRNYLPRFFYGTSTTKYGYSQVGTYPKDQYTMPMNKTLQKIGEEIVNFVSSCEEFQKIHKHNKRQNSKISFQAINHCSILVYFGLNGYKRYSTLSSHCDNTYRPNGDFVHKVNSRVENTPTITLTIGDPRTIRYHRRYSSDGVRWDEELKHVHTDYLSHGTINVVHPDDERPFEVRLEGNSKPCQIQHGHVRVGLNKMSIALVFRTVKNVSLFHKDTHQRQVTKVIPKKDEKIHRQLHKSVDKRDFQTKLQNLYSEMMCRHPELA